MSHEIKDHPWTECPGEGCPFHIVGNGPRSDPSGPVYRFWGHQKPNRSAPRNMADVVSAEEGVATMRLYDPIDSWGGEWGVSAKEFAEALGSLPDDTAEIRLHINSPGGEVYEGIAIMNALRAHKARTVAVVDGLAASAASFLAAGMDEVIMGKNTQLMIHDAWGLAIGNAEDMREMGERLDKISNNIAHVYADKTGAPVEDMRALMLAETWMDAEEAVELKFADSVQGEATQEAKNRFDLSMFNHDQEKEQEPPVVAPPSVEKVDAPASPDTTPDAITAYQQRRHRMNARRHARA